MPKRYDYGLKCICGLHFQVHSWSSTWYADHPAFCPECGKPGAIQLTRDEVEGQIFEVVSARADKPIEWKES